LTEEIASLLIGLQLTIYAARDGKAYSFLAESILVCLAVVLVGITSSDDSSSLTFYRLLDPLRLKSFVVWLA
jgi:hypothetical protein